MALDWMAAEAAMAREREVSRPLTPAEATVLELRTEEGERRRRAVFAFVREIFAPDALTPEAEEEARRLAA